MTALAADKNVQSRKDQTVTSFPVNALSVIYKGALVVIDAQGYLRPGVDTAGFKCVGVADAAKTGGAADGDEDVDVISGRDFLLTGTNLTQALVGTVVYLVDDATVGPIGDTTNEVAVGVLIEYVSATSGWVRIPTLPGADQPDYTVNTVDIVDEAVTVAKMADLARGSILVGAASDRPAALDANDSGKILVGDGTDLASVAVSGDATLASNGALTVAAGAITKAKSKTFFSTEVTATGSAQNVAHGLAAVPAGVLISMTEHPGTPDTGAMDIAEGAHDGTNVVFTATANIKVKILAWA